MKPLLLCTDLDRTLLPNGAEPESPQARAHFRRLAAQPTLTLAYVTGRDLSLVSQAIEKYEIPRPSFALTDVGTSLYQTQAEGAWQRLTTWDTLLASAWHTQTSAQIADLLADLPALQIQEKAKQGRFKLSFYVDLGHDPQTLMQKIQARLRTNALKAQLIWSLDEQAEIGLLDLLPETAGKRQAIEFLMQHLGFSIDNSLFAGDSGNDLDVLLSPLKSILVANAAAEVRETLRTQHTNTYFAQGGYLGMNGCYSAGILEGVAHYFPEYAANEL